MTIFILGGYSETLGFGLCDNFHLGGGGYSETLRFGLCDNFHLFILKLSDLDSVTIFILGGYSETLRFGLCDNFYLGGLF